ncbi:lysophospholipid acyltransferase family protein [Chitinilyticum piscinae]|nr:lysophospholipid acyltransferase family protein [Chitinilyticum piscinae]
MLRPHRGTIALGRLCALMLHLLKGLWLTCTRYPRLERAEQAALLQRWSRQLLATLGIEVRLRGQLPAQMATCGQLIVANHISWLDIFAINSCRPSRFVAKSEIRNWPLIGTLVTRAGTLYIERGRQRATRDTKQILDQHLCSGDCIAFFPEGTTSDGSQLKPFRGGLIQSALDHGVAIQPVLLQYRNQHGLRSMAAAYIDDVSLLSCIWQLAYEPRTIVELEFLAPRSGLPQSRKEITRLIEEEMRQSLQAC